MTTPTAQEVAREYSKVLRDWLSEEEMAEVIRLNKAQANPSVCHSHDFCDANMAMQEAFRNLKTTTPFDASGDDEEAQVTELWNEAWDIAKKSEFAVEA